MKNPDDNGYGHSPINMDGLTPQDLIEVAQLYRTLNAYAEHKLAAMGNRSLGNIKAAIQYERFCEANYAKLPAWAKW